MQDHLLEGDACEGRRRGGADCAGLLHTPDCDARDGDGHTHLHACGEGEIPHTPQFWWGDGAERPRLLQTQCH